MNSSGTVIGTQVPAALPKTEFPPGSGSSVVTDGLSQAQSKAATAAHKKTCILFIIIAKH